MLVNVIQQPGMSGEMLQCCVAALRNLCVNCPDNQQVNHWPTTGPIPASAYSLSKQTGEGGAETPGETGTPFVFVCV